MPRAECSDEAARKRFKAYLRHPEAQAYLRALSRALGMPVTGKQGCALVDTREPDAWIHPLVALHLACGLELEFGRWMIERIRERGFKEYEEFTRGPRREQNEAMLARFLPEEIAAALFNGTRA